ncbi:MAG: hypothetical protein AAF610_00320 [Pseudomonadota bacterium]
MRLSEVLLRLGTSLVAWILLLTYLIWLGVVGRIGCGPDGDELHKLVLGLAPFAVGSAFALRATQPLDEVHRILRWIAVFLVILTPSALHAIWTVFGTVWLSGDRICAEGSVTSWENAWPIVHGMAIVAIAVLIRSMWQPSAAETESG